MPVAQLVPAGYNPRAMTEAARAGLRASLTTFGLVQPIVWNSRSGRVVGGHQRLTELVAQGVHVTDVVVVDLDDERERALNVTLNNPAIAGDFTADVGAILDGLEASLGDLFGGLRLDALADALESLTRKPSAKGDPDEVHEPPAQPTSRRGDLFVLGRHRLLCGDSTNPEDVARVLDGARPRLMLTDPPYGVSLDMEWRDRAGLNGMGPAEHSYLQRRVGFQNTTISGDDKADWSDAFELVPSLDTAYVWHASSRSVEVGFGLRRIGFELKQQIIWRKPRFVLSRQHYHWQHEPCWYARKDGSAKFRGARDQSTIWDAASPKMLMNPAGEHEEKVDHPTQKPVCLYTRPIENHLKRGEAFYEPFGGSGSAIAAAEITERRCFAIELDPKYVDVIVTRWERLTGKRAELHAAPAPA